MLDMVLSKLEMDKESELSTAQMMYDEIISMPVAQKQELIENGFWTIEDYNRLIDLSRTRRNIRSKFYARRKALQKRYATKYSICRDIHQHNFQL